MSRRVRGYQRRTVEKRELIDRFLIVCEGAKTEPNYFRKFRVPANVIDVYGVGDNTVGIVQRAIELRNADGDYDQVWCVFDRNSFPAQNFNQALAMASANNISVAYSNESFELWYLLHFNFYDAAISRADYIKKLKPLLGGSYEKNDETIYEQLLKRQPAALRNAKQLLARYEPCHPECDNPSTTVHLLVDQLNRFVR